MGQTSKEGCKVCRTTQMQLQNPRLATFACPKKGDGPPTKPSDIKTCHCGGQAALLMPCCRQVCNHTTSPSALADSSSSRAAMSAGLPRCRTARINQGQLGHSSSPTSRAECLISSAEDSTGINAPGHHRAAERGACTPVDVHH